MENPFMKRNSVVCHFLCLSFIIKHTKNVYKNTVHGRGPKHKQDKQVNNIQSKRSDKTVENYKKYQNSSVLALKI